MDGTSTVETTTSIASVAGWLVPLIILIAIVVVVLIIVNKVRQTTQKYLGMSPSQTMELISKGLKEEATTPKGITALSEMYGPAITRDFPEIGYNGMEVKARNAIVAILNAIMRKNPDLLKADDFTHDLVNKVNNRITSLNARNEKEIFNNIKVHRCGISGYRNVTKEATARFEISLQYEYARVPEDKPDSVKPVLTQTAYSVTLAYKQDMHEHTSSIVYSSNCPNCGAPIDVSERGKKCPYCGSGFKEIADRVWLVNDFNLVK